MIQMQLLISKPGVVSTNWKWITIPQAEENLQEELKEFGEFIIADYSGRATFFSPFITEYMDLLEFNKNLIKLQEIKILSEKELYAAIDCYDNFDFSSFVHDLAKMKINVISMEQAKDWQMSTEEAAGRLLWEKNALQDVNLSGLTTELADWICWEDIWYSELNWRITKIREEYFLVNCAW